MRKRASSTRDLTPAVPAGRPTLFEQATRDRGAGRPTKRERRETDRLRPGAGPEDD